MTYIVSSGALNSTHSLREKHSFDGYITTMLKEFKDCIIR